MDGLAWMFCLLVTGVGFLVVLYARYYMSPRDPVARFFAFFLAFMGSMLGVVLSGSLFQLVFFWEPDRHFMLVNTAVTYTMLVRAALHRDAAQGEDHLASRLRPGAGGPEES